MTRTFWQPVACWAVLASGLASCRGPGPVDLATVPFPEAQKEVERTLLDLLAAAERKDFAWLEGMHLYGPKFSKWGEKAPGRMDAEATRRAERAGIEALDAFRPAVEELKVDVFGQTAVTTFTMPYEVVSAGETLKAEVRATLVWVKVDSDWRIVHEHFSPPPAKR